MLARAADAPRLRIALCASYFEGNPVNPEVAAAVRALALQVQRLGHEVQAARPAVRTLALIRPLAHVVACRHGYGPGPAGRQPWLHRSR